ncbi:MAG: tRNA uridine-5-carboxymethylaminomethyl(34) synthesis enzyme MnmG, partial [Prevotella sp.]|nr:tRNA uridine-5-carboxymethylaminomethyl(34) synthesis enzyme MnmG [Prevotella sp.]
RQDNADARLTEKGYALGLASTERMTTWKRKEEGIKHILDFSEKFTVKPQEINSLLEKIEGQAPLKSGTKLSELIARPQLSMALMAQILPALAEQLNLLPDRKEEIIESAEIMMKYKGYIERENIVAQKMQKMENIKIKDRFDYDSIREISTEGRQKLARINPETLAQASRIPGVSPSDLSVLLVLLGR